ncbi:MAG TPA: medium chain dehydrogenase/reductase family protein [Vicinamibacterales bacterium]|nr:medium chain dehydrogenase/reductase family protein [Vicinamibacterales bacterium]
MRQAVITRTGPPEVLQIREAPDPTPRAGEVRIAVRAAGVNFADIMARLGLYPDAPKLPAVVGYEVAGVVDAVGEGVDAFRAGDRVLALTRFGGYASAVAVPAAQVFAVPPPLSDDEAAAIPVTYLTAHIALYKLANVAAGESVLIYGAGGGVGVAATQLAKLRKAIVIGTASTAKLEAIRAIGVDHAVDRTRDDVPEVVRRLTSHRGADVILDSIGGKNFSVSYTLLAPLGRLVIFGASSIAAGERRSLWAVARTVLSMRSFGPLSLMNQNRAVMGLNLGHLWTEGRQLRAAMDDILAHAAAGRLRPVVAKTFPLEQAAEAHRYIQSRGNIGKVILRPAD